MTDTESISAKIEATAIGEAVQVLDNLVLFRVDKQRFRYGQSYALLRDGQLILVDAVHQATKAAVDRWRAQYPVAALVLTHRDLLGQAFGPIPEVAAWLDAPVLIHSRDQQGTAAQPLEEAPDLLARLQLRYFAIPGHSPGSVAFYAAPEQFLFSGDSAVGPNYDNPAVGFTHPPIADAAWPEFVRGWEQITEPVQAVLPLHGQPAFGAAELPAIRQRVLARGNVMRV